MLRRRSYPSPVLAWSNVTSLGQIACFSKIFCEDTLNSLFAYVAGKKIILNLFRNSITLNNVKNDDKSCRTFFTHRFYEYVEGMVGSELILLNSFDLMYSIKICLFITYANYHFLFEQVAMLSSINLVFLLN